ncbi:MAG: hypothetical protein KDA79_04190 [Planctomycetaceae bacterium]|nr:hypothetical protein [Planctomycetaceae bacterium]
MSEVPGQGGIVIVDTEAVEIQKDMSRVRERLNDDVDEVVAGARQLADWRYYVKNYPWGVLAGAVAVGYFAVPQQTRLISPNADELEKLASRNKLVVKQKPEAGTRSSLAQTALTLAGNMVFRAAIAWAGQQAGKVMGHKAAEEEPSTGSQGSFSGVAGLKGGHTVS